MTNQYILYGWQVSYFTAKVRAYLNYKSLDYREIPPNFIHFGWFAKEVDAAVIPVLKTPEGKLLADSSLIIEELERRNSYPSIIPPTPKQKILSELFEAWIDEVGLPIALHTRWSHSENYATFLQEAGKAVLPIPIKPLRNALLEKTVANKMRRYAKDVGVVPEQIPLLNKWINYVLDLLESHFQQHNYLFGGRPTIADYGLIGLCQAHLFIDPWSKRELIEPRPHLMNYILRVHNGEDCDGTWLQEDDIPQSLVPIFELIFKEFFPLVEQTSSMVQRYIKDNNTKQGQSIKRMPGSISMPMLDGYYTKKTQSYTLWMMQRLQDDFLRLPETEQTEVDKWFSSLGQPSLKHFCFGPRVERYGLKVRRA